LSDWADTTGETKRVGVAHGLGNVAALGLYAASLVARRRSRRSTGVLLSLAGAGVATLTAYLGGHLVYGRGMGVDQTTFEPRIRKWKPAIADTDLAEGKPLGRQVEGVKVMLYRTGDRIYALSNRCNHLGGPLDQGQINDGTVVCPWHSSTFRLSDGQVLQGPATGRQPTWETRVKDGQIEVRRAS
ncbi:MAG: Rieske 2Fe-2S domain-containing protein, partial [Actinomycetota bacterium]|nr:Rieske 2Fe-2S domain-containing protein [Actinomycetota bacterium]